MKYKISLWLALVCEISNMSQPARAQDQSNIVTQRLASLTFAIPRDILQMIYKPNYEPNANPNWSTEPVIRIAVRWPDFKAGKPNEDLVNITLSSLADHPIVPIEQVMINLTKSNLQPTIEPADFGLEELRSKLSTDFNSRQFIARLENSSNLLIRCPNISFACEFDFKFKDVKVNVYFRGDNIRDWREIYNKSVTLLSSLLKD